MLRSDAAKQWNPDAFGRAMIDLVARLLILSERSSQHLRSLSFPGVKQLWERIRADFQNSPAQYPSVMADINDIEGRRQFREKWEAICFSQQSPSSPEQCVFYPYQLPWQHV
jgi:hypothetical protein